MFAMQTPSVVMAAKRKAEDGAGAKSKRPRHENEEPYAAAAAAQNAQEAAIAVAPAAAPAANALLKELAQARMKRRPEEHAEQQAMLDKFKSEQQLAQQKVELTTSDEYFGIGTNI